MSDRFNIFNWFKHIVKFSKQIIKIFGIEVDCSFIRLYLGKDKFMEQGEYLFEICMLLTKKRQDKPLTQDGMDCNCQLNTFYVVSDLYIKTTI